MTGMLFFSGGSALANISRFLARNKIPSFHLITTFDNGGSSAELRKAFAMPAVGDLRNRMLALASSDVSPALMRILKLRLLKNQPSNILNRQLELIASPDNPNLQGIPDNAAHLLREALTSFTTKKPPLFNLANASIGNLVISGLYLQYNRDLDTALALLGSMLKIQGRIAPITLANLQLGALLDNDRIIIGQQKFKNLPASVRKIFLTVHEKIENFSAENSLQSCNASISESGKNFIASANLICYPPGSFYSSVLANLLTSGTAEAISQSKAVKIMLPNSGHDPEASGMGIAEQARRIMGALNQNCNFPVESLLNYVLIDKHNGDYQGDLDKDIRILKNMGIKVIDAPIISPANRSCHLPAATIAALLKISGTPLHEE